MHRRGFSLIELMVVLPIIAILIALIMPAVQLSREAARRLNCSSNLSQVSLAIHQYETAFRTFPAGNQGGYSYMVAVLPYIDQQPLYNEIRWDSDPATAPATQIRARIPVFLCPSDDVAVGTKGTASYSGNMGFDVQSNGYVGVFHALNAQKRGWRRTFWPERHQRWLVEYYDARRDPRG
jgi:prepilin-type N-terminal cleavage/methylation domain-containing protein